LTADLRFGIRSCVSERIAFKSFAEAIAHAEALQKAQRERDEYKKLYTHLREENERLKRGLLGKKAEKLPQNDAQLSLAILGLLLGGGEEPPPPPAHEESTQVIPEHTRKVPKRRGPSDDWPRVYIELIPPEVEREGLDAFDIIGQETRGVLERRPASCVFVEFVRKKFESRQAGSRDDGLHR
jgi:transposase